MYVLNRHLQRMMPALVISTYQQWLLRQVLETFTRFDSVWDLGSWSDRSILAIQIVSVIKGRIENKALLQFIWI